MGFGFKPIKRSSVLLFYLCSLSSSEASAFEQFFDQVEPNAIFMMIENKDVFLKVLNHPDQFLWLGKVTNAEKQMGETFGSSDSRKIQEGARKLANSVSCRFKHGPESSPAEFIGVPLIALYKEESEQKVKAYKGHTVSLQRISFVFTPGKPKVSKLGLICEMFGKHPHFSVERVREALKSVGKIEVNEALMEKIRAQEGKSK